MKKTNFKTGSINIILLGIVSFINDAGSEMIIPILPLFIASLGGTGLIVGLIGGINDSITSLLKVICGYWSDKTGKRKIFVFSGYLTSAGFKLILSFSFLWQHILVFSGLERFGKGIRTASRDAIIADSTPEKRGKGFGIHRSLDTAGAILGSIIVFLLIYYISVDFNVIILIAACISFFSIVPLFFIKEIKSKSQKISFKLSIKKLPKSLKIFLVISGIFSFANFSYMFFILRAQTIFSDEWSIIAPILLYVLFNIFYALFAIPCGTLSDRIGRKKVILSGYFLFSITTMGFALFSSLYAFIILFALYGIVYAFIDGNQRALVSDLSHEKFRATALGTYHTIVGLVALPSSLIAGYLWEVINPSSTFLLGGAVSLITVIIFIIFISKK